VDEAFWTIDELAERCGHYCWLEERLFALAGCRASAPAPVGPGASGAASVAAARVLLSEMAAHHAFLAAQWRARLPVRAGVDVDGLIVAHAGPPAAALDLVADEPDLTLVLDGLAEELLPRLLRAYRDHLAVASPVREGPVRDVLELAGLRGHREIQAARALLGRPGPTAASNAATAGATAVGPPELRRRVQQAMGGAVSILPAARAS
jgi:hypothetical protein